MTKPYSEDLRTRVVAAVVVGASCRDAAKRFSIGVSGVAVGAAVPADRERRGQADGRGAQFASQRRARLAARPHRGGARFAAS
jgi:transposase